MVWTEEESVEFFDSMPVGEHRSAWGELGVPSFCMDWWETSTTVVNTGVALTPEIIKAAAERVAQNSLTAQLLWV